MEYQASGVPFTNRFLTRLGNDWVITPMILCVIAHQFSHLNVSFTILLLKLGHGWVITSHSFTWMWLLSQGKSHSWISQCILVTGTTEKTLMILHMGLTVNFAYNDFLPNKSKEHHIWFLQFSFLSSYIDNKYGFQSDTSIDYHVNGHHLLVFFQDSFGNLNKNNEISIYPMCMWFICPLLLLGNKVRETLSIWTLNQRPQSSMFREICTHCNILECFSWFQQIHDLLN